MVKNNGTTLLRNLVLGISEGKTEDEISALNLIKELINEFDASVPLDVVEEKSKGTRTPWLYASNSVFYGLNQIEGFARQERLLREQNSIFA